MSTVGKYPSHRKESYSEKATVSFERKFHRSAIQSNLTSLLRQRPRVPLSTLSVDHSPPHRFILNGERRGESHKLYSGRILLSPCIPRHDTWNGQIKGYRVLHVSFPPTSNPPSPPPAAELNTVIGIHHQMPQSQNLAETHILFERTQPMVSKPDNIDRSGTTTALNSLQPFTNYSIQVRK